MPVAACFSNGEGRRGGWRLSHNQPRPGALPSKGLRLQCHVIFTPQARIPAAAS